MARILVLTDDPKTRNRTQRALRGQGHDVIWCHAARRAARSIEARAPDLMLIDCAVLGERWALNRARAAEACGIRVILLTTDATRLRALRRANMPALEKPPSLPQLNELVGQTLSTPFPSARVAPTIIERCLDLVVGFKGRVRRRFLRTAGRWFDRHVGEYRHAGLRFEVPREMSTLEFRARFLLHRYEVPERILTRKYVSSDATVLELGGCLGVIACQVNRRLSDPRRHVVLEGHPLIIPYLEANRARNGCHFEVRQQVISRAPNAIVYCRDPLIAGSSMVRIGARKVAVETTTIERLERETGFTFDTLVIDIEGGELAFFAENEEVLQRLRVVIVEFHPHIIGNAACAEIRSRFAAGGLRFRSRRGSVEAWLRPS